MERAENAESGGCLQRESTECKEYAGAQSAARPETGETEVREPKLLEKILFRDNMNRAYKRVKANKGTPGVDGMTVTHWKKAGRLDHPKTAKVAARAPMFYMLTVHTLPFK